MAASPLPPVYDPGVRAKIYFGWTVVGENVAGMMRGAFEGALEGVLDGRDVVGLCVGAFDVGLTVVGALLGTTAKVLAQTTRRGRFEGPQPSVVYPVMSV
jgi:hypothetical protein